MQPSLLTNVHGEGFSALDARAELALGGLDGLFVPLGHLQLSRADPCHWTPSGAL